MEPVMIILLMGVVIWINVWFRRQQRRRWLQDGNRPELRRARRRARRPARMMIVPPSELGRWLDDRQVRDIGVALAERRLDDAVELWGAATGDDQLRALRSIDTWMADGTRISLDTRPEQVNPASDSPWPELPSRNTEPGSPHNDRH